MTQETYFMSKQELYELIYSGRSYRKSALSGGKMVATHIPASRVLNMPDYEVKSFDWWPCERISRFEKLGRMNGYD